MESDNIQVQGEHVQVHVGPRVVVEGDLQHVHNSRTLVCCHCSKSVHTENIIIFMYFASSILEQVRLVSPELLCGQPDREPLLLPR